MEILIQMLQHVQNPLLHHPYCSLWNPSRHLLGLHIRLSRLPPHLAGIAMPQMLFHPNGCPEEVQRAGLRVYSYSSLRSLWIHVQCIQEIDLLNMIGMISI